MMSRVMISMHSSMPPSGERGSKLVARLLHQGIELLMTQRIKHKFYLGNRPQQVLYAPEQLGIPGNDDANRLFQGMADGRRSCEMRLAMRSHNVSIHF